MLVNRDWILLCLRIATTCLFLGRGYLYLSGFTPLSAFFWRQNWLEAPLLQLFNLPWEAYAANSEPFIVQVQQLMGALFLLSALATWRCGERKRVWANGIVIAGILCLLPYWLLRWFDSNLQVGMFFEHFLQWGTPLLLLLYFRVNLRAWKRLVWLFVSLTFIGHGLYALGWGVPLDHNFVNMTQRLLGLDVSTARLFLRCVGLIDLLLPALLLLPFARIPAVLYATVWGILTALARIFAHWTAAEKYYGMHPWFAEAVVRLPHGIVPLALLLLYWRLHHDCSEERIFETSKKSRDSMT
jgi:uncharacterized membrane protein YphA (DoxX/SURF4 family)